MSLSPGKVEAVEAQASYPLPDGSTLDIGPARFKAPELLFKPDLIGEEYFGIHQVSVDLPLDCESVTTLASYQELFIQSGLLSDFAEIRMPKFMQPCKEIKLEGKFHNDCSA